MVCVIFKKSEHIFEYIIYAMKNQSKSKIINN